MNPLDIVSIDCVKNYPGRGHNPAEVAKAFEVYMQEGFSYLQYGPVLVIYSSQEEGVAEFHCMNAGGAAELVKAVLSALGELSKAYGKAVTFYDNPKVSALMAQSTYPVTVTRIDGGTDRTFKAEFDLRS